MDITIHQQENQLRKKQLIESVLSQRTEYLTLVFQDTYQPLNASAVIRSAELFGIQKVYTIEERNSFRSSVGISRGAVAWIDIIRHQTAASCIAELRQEGYCIVATTVSSKAIPLNQLPVNKKMALVFGNELRGVTDYVLDVADIHTYIPMYGFTQSFNLSVSAGIFLQELMPKIKADQTIKWALSEQKKSELRERWNLYFKCGKSVSGS